MRKHIYRVVGLCVCLLMIGALILSAQEKAPAPAQPLANVDKEAPPTITVEWVEKPLRSALEAIGDVGNVNIVIDTQISNEDKVTVTFRNLEWRQALEETTNLAKCILEEAGPSVFRVTKPPTINMDLRNAPLDEVIRQIAKMAGVNIIMTDDIKGSITMMLTDVPWLEALQSIIKTTGFSLVQEKHNVVRIVRTETLREQLETRVFQIKYLRPPGAFKATISTPYAVGAVKPTGDSVSEFTLLNILRNMLTRKGDTPIGSLQYDMKTNSLIVRDTKVVLDAMEKMIERLDVAPEQILIELKFVSTSNEDLMNFGLKYNFGGSIDPKSEIMTSKPSPNQVTTSLPFGFGRKQDDTFNQFFLNTYDVSTVLRLFKTDTRSKFIQEPNLITLDGEEATVFVGELIRYATTTVAYSSAGLPFYSLTEASPINVGFQLWVTPNVVKGTNQLLVTLIPRLEDLSGKDAGFETYEVAGMSIKLPRVRQSTVVTRILIESGQTAVIGGLVDERLSKTVERVPGFGDIPILGEPFRYRGKSLTERRLLVFVTPRIIKTAEVTTKVLSDKIADIESPITMPFEPVEKGKGKDKKTK
ncbi:MAG: secretin N-terminal domain-containing protein [Planctomycetota bacterium]